jgi:hypothetical protein
VTVGLNCDRSTTSWSFFVGVNTSVYRENTSNRTFCIYPDRLGDRGLVPCIVLAPGQVVCKVLVSSSELVCRFA